ncbi:TonB-dependent siderophore receptor [Phytohalomonas tamaricis]|uniref:TonB-dependent siderophore receptor n=1 Tax=Phytohalomonas tamaricis TaxID=2081032 RepID=UPI0021D427DC|nr:TonB-dependent siderophore receptor [Phytohalomonas tamaricis]
MAEQTTTGSKTNTSLVSLSRSVSTVTEEEMEKRKVQDLEQALSYTSGVGVSQYGSDARYDFLLIRGFEETSLGTYRDGLRYQTDDFTGSRLEPYGLQRIDVLKGSTSTLFGLNAPGGIANAITKRPLDYDFGEVYTTLGDGHTETGADFGGPIDQAGEWTYRITTNWQDADRGAEHTRDDRFYFAPALTWKPSDATTLTLLADFNDRKSNASQSIPYGSGIDPKTFLGEPDYDAMDTIARNIGYQFSHDFGNGFGFDQNARYTHIDMTYNTVYGGTADPADSRSAFGVYGESDQYAIDNQLHYDTDVMGAGSRTLVGFDYFKSDTLERQYYGTAPGLNINNPDYCGTACISLDRLADFDQKMTSQGYYLQEELTFNDQWILTLGGRYDAVNTESGSDDEVNDYDFTKRIGLTYKIQDDLSLYANYAESFQPPASRSLISGRAKPQEGEQYEVGMKYRPANTNALFTVALFDLTQTNVTQQVSTTQYRQIGEVNVKGLELEGKVALSNRLNLTAAYSYWDAEIEEDGIGGNKGNRPAVVPEHLASVWADYTIPGDANRGDITVGLGTRFVGSTYSDDANTGKVASYTLVDAMASYQFSPKVDLTVNATNLFDREYISYIDTYSNSAYYGNDRSVLTTLRYHW